MLIAQDIISQLSDANPRFVLFSILSVERCLLSQSVKSEGYEVGNSGISSRSRRDDVADVEDE